MRRFSIVVCLLAVGCSDTGIGASTRSAVPSEIPPGELCTPLEAGDLTLRAHPPRLVVAPGQRRTARVVVEPEVCAAHGLSFVSDDPAVAGAGAEATLEYGRAEARMEVIGGALGETQVTAVLDVNGAPVTASVAVEVMAADEIVCASGDGASGRLEAGGAVSASGGLSGASLALPVGADAPEAGSFLWRVEPFDASLACAADIVPAGHRRLGPAVTFGPADATFRRDVPMTIPVNPVLMPEASTPRHIRVAYRGPAFREPRVVPVTSPRFEKVDGQWRLHFKAPRLGTYQAVVEKDAGATSRARRLTHRALIGISMGGAGAAQLGTRYHHLFDAVVALGGPVDWTYMMNHVETNMVGGFRPIPPGATADDVVLERAICDTSADCASDETCLGKTASTAGKCTLLPAPTMPYEHPSTFNTLWYEEGNGNGGGFSRRDYINLFRDLSLLFGNPFGFNPAALHLAPGIDPSHPFITAGRDDDACAIWVSPYDHPEQSTMQELASTCPVERCQHTQVLSGYYDETFNPDGTFDVITFCDGSPQNLALSPYSNTWTPEGHTLPVEAGLAVDVNGNGKRDELEPIIGAGAEPFRDWGLDQTPSELEPGYGPDNLDPSGDDYDPRYNPTGTEGDGRYQLGEPFDDVGLDGVAGTAASPYDHGEGDGVFTVAPGRQYMWDLDSRSMLRGWSPLVAAPLDDKALARVDYFTDGGTRDLFNFLGAAEHFMGSFVARGRAAAAYHELTAVPGLDPTGPLTEVELPRMAFEDAPGIILHRYGKDDPTADDLASGSGMHVGTGQEALLRIGAGLYFISSRWPDAPRALVEVASKNPAAGVDECEVKGNCAFDFTSSFGRTGPVAVSLPEGYGHADLQDRRYPVIFMFHGYGMTPEDLQVARALLNTFSNNPSESQATRLAKAILVYVDGRCRWQDGEAECFTGTFYGDSLRPGGAQIDAWFLELVDHIDRRFRTMGESVVDWTP